MIFLNFNSYFGHTVKLSPDGNKLFVSAPKTGTLHSFQYANGQWTRYGGTILETNNSFEQFAKSFSVNTNCDLIAIGNSFYDRSTTSSGAVTFYSLINGIWTKTGQITGAPQAMIGNHVSISDNNVVAISSIKNNLNQSVSGSLMVYKIDLPNQLYTQLGNTLNAGYNDFLTINDISKTSNKVMTSAVYGANSNNVKTGYVKTFGYEAFLGTSEINAVKSFTVYPNPTKGKIYFNDPENKIDFIKVFNASHQLVLQKKIQPGEAGINLPDQKGLYWVTFHLKDSGSLTKKIIVE